MNDIKSIKFCETDEPQNINHKYVLKIDRKNK